MLVLLFPALGLVSLGLGHLPVSTAGPCELVLKKTSQKRPHTGPWQKRLCNGPNPDVNVVRGPVQIQELSC